MKTWIQRSLIGLIGAGVLFGGLAAYAHNRAGGPMGAMMGPRSEADISRMRAHVVDKLQRELALDAAQQAKLNTLADVLQQQRLALAAGRDQASSPRSLMQQFVAGPQFDRAGAQALLEAKLAALQKAGPEVLSAAADFYDGLRPEQQDKVRAFMAQAHGRGQASPRG